MAIETVQSESDVDELLELCESSQAHGTSKYPGMSYEDGIIYTIRWLRGDPAHPMED